LNDIADVIHRFKMEFGSIAEKFVIIELPIKAASGSWEENVAMPGVYVYWHPQKGVIKVGRHLTNSRKRALEHIRDNTNGTMATLLDDDATQLLLFNVKENKDKHWVAALEIYFETVLIRSIPSKRLG